MITNWCELPGCSLVEMIHIFPKHALIYMIIISLLNERVMNYCLFTGSLNFVCKMQG